MPIGLDVSAGGTVLPPTNGLVDGDLIRDSNGALYLIQSGNRWSLPDKITAGRLEAERSAIREINPSTLEKIPQAGVLPSIDVTGTYYRDASNGTREFYYLERGKAYRIDAALDVVVQYFGSPAPLESVFLFGDYANLLGRASRIDLRDAAISSWGDIYSYLRSIPPPAITAAPGLSVASISESSKPYTAQGGVTYHVTESIQRITNVLNAFPVVAPVGDVIWPGALVQGSSLPSGLLAPIQIDARSPGRLEITSELIVDNPGAPQAADIHAPTQATVNQARRNILTELGPRASTDRITVDVYSIHDTEQISARLGVNLSGSGWSASADASMSGSLDVSTTVVKLQQVFYTANFTPTGSPAKYFDDTVTVDDLKRFSGTGNAPCYISQVQYGRIFLLRISARESASQVDVKVKAAWSAAVSGDAQAQAHWRSTTSAYEVSIGAVGVTGATTFQSIGDLVDTLLVLAKTADYSTSNPGAVISYTLRYLLDGSIAQAVIGPFEYKAYTRGEVPTESFNYEVWDDSVRGKPGGVNTNVLVRPGDVVTISAFGQVNAGWWFGSDFGPAGDNSQHGRDTGNGTKPLWGAPFTALLYGFGTGWFTWADTAQFTYGETSQSQPDGGNPTIGNTTTPLPMYVHINDDNVLNGSGRFFGSIYVQRRALAGVNPI
ncbi:thiol-activated cytolysin family protein [Nonomuraea bangladeshensis]|uniref:thiol-activated cytolysin family protein n=1 Tax=Nonomuraea bangladeshensis TaxID=404385 RepID=UPI003C2D9F94